MPEMVRLNKWLQTEKIYLEIKRGFKPKHKSNYQIKNDELGQLILSFAFQKPGTSRSGKKVIFENQAIYNSLFKVNYMKEESKKRFILDLIKLKTRYDEVEKKLKSSGLNSTELEVLKNGRQTVFAIMGMCYRLANDDITENDINNDAKSLGSIPFNYGPILSKYQNDDINEKFEGIVRDIIEIMADAYTQAIDEKKTTSVSNFMKTDQKYYDGIVSKVIKGFRYNAGKHLKENIDIFKR